MAEMNHETNLNLNLYLNVCNLQSFSDVKLVFTTKVILNFFKNLLKCMHEKRVL